MIILVRFHFYIILYSYLHLVCKKLLLKFYLVKKIILCKVLTSNFFLILYCLIVIETYFHRRIILAWQYFSFFNSVKDYIFLFVWLPTNTI